MAGSAWCLLLQRLAVARSADRPAPPKGRAKVRARAIERDAARLVLAGQPNIGGFHVLLERWMAQHITQALSPVPVLAFTDAVRFRIEQLDAVERLQELADQAQQADRARDDQDAVALSILA
jgi:hypothetical protein